MSNVGSTLDSICNELENQSQNIKQKVASVNNVWSGEAQQSFNSAHLEAQQCMQRVKSNLQSLKSLARSLDSSIQAAERDMAAKRAAEQAARNNRR